MPTIAFTSVGCKLNRYEVQLMSEKLKPFGFNTVSFNQAADCYVINTCSVTSDADFSSRQSIRRARRRAPDARIVVTGCYAHLRPDEMKDLGADLVASNTDKNRVPGLVLEMFRISGADALTEREAIITGMSGMTRAFVKIEDGCDEKCTFCTIKLARGPVRSRPAKAIVDEINALTGNGYKEVALTGVHIGKYIARGMNFSGLLRELMKSTSIDRIRLSSLNPAEIDDDLISLMKSEPRICPHVHLSIQSGDDDILRAMGRKYSRSDVISVVGKLASSIEYITIGADIMVGFPGETEAQFQNSHELLALSEIHHLHVFPYSDRPGVAAARMGGKISPHAKAARTQTLRILGREKKRAHLKRFIGRKLSVLIENRENGLSNSLSGLSENYLRVVTSGDERLKGEIVDLWPDKVENDGLIADSAPLTFLAESR